MATKEDLLQRIKQELDARQQDGEMMNLHEYSDAMATAIFITLSDQIIDAEDRNFVFNKEVAATTWNITHNLNKFPDIYIKDTDGNDIEGIVQYIDVNNLTVVFSIAIAGTAYLN